MYVSVLYVCVWCVCVVFGDFSPRSEVSLVCVCVLVCVCLCVCVCACVCVCVCVCVINNAVLMRL